MYTLEELVTRHRLMLNLHFGVLANTLILILTRKVMLSPETYSRMELIQFLVILNLLLWGQFMKNEGIWKAMFPFAIKQQPLNGRQQIGSGIEVMRFWGHILKGVPLMRMHGDLLKVS